MTSHVLQIVRLKLFCTAKMIPGRQAVSRFATHETRLLRNLTLPPPYKLMDFLLQTPTYLIFSGSCQTCFSDIPQLSQTSTRFWLSNVSHTQTRYNWDIPAQLCATRAVWIPTMGRLLDIWLCFGHGRLHMKCTQFKDNTNVLCSTFPACNHFMAVDIFKTDFRQRIWAFQYILHM